MARAKKAAAAATSATEGTAAPSETPVVDAAAAAIVAQAAEGDAPEEAPLSGVLAAEAAGDNATSEAHWADVGEPLPEIPPAAGNADEGEGAKLWPGRLGHEPLMTLLLDGVEYQPGDLVFVTREEFAPLRAARVFAGEWEYGFEGLDDDD